MTRPLQHPRDRTQEEEAEARRVAEYLAAHPSFLTERPALYRTLHPPRRVHGETLADHMEAMLQAARAETGAVASAARAGQDMALRACGAVAALIGAPDPIAVIAQEWPLLLGLETVSLAAEGVHARHVRHLPQGMVDRLLPESDLRLRDYPPDAAPEDAALLHGEASGLVTRDALLRLPGTTPRLLALGARAAACLPRHGASAPLRLLAQALAAALDGRA